MTLQGSLDAFGLADVLQMLAGTAKTGCLQVEGDAGRATIWLRGGAVTSAASDRSAAMGPSIDEVVCDLLRTEDGTFAFDEGAESADGADRAEDVPRLLDRAGALLAERRDLEALVPSFDHRVGLAGELPVGGHVTITAEQWTALVAVGPGCTVGELATSLGLTELAALRTVQDLVTAGLTTVDPPAPRPARRSRRSPDPDETVLGTGYLARARYPVPRTDDPSSPRPSGPDRSDDLSPRRSPGADRGDDHARAGWSGDDGGDDDAGSGWPGDDGGDEGAPSGWAGDERGEDVPRRAGARSPEGRDPPSRPGSRPPASAPSLPRRGSLPLGDDEDGPYWPDPPPPRHPPRRRG